MIARNGAEFAAMMRARLARVVAQDAPAAVAEAGDLLAEAIAGRADRRTGRLAASVKRGRVRRKGYRVSTSVEIGATHAALAEEFGTKDRPADPFIRPGAEAAGNQIRRILGRVAQSL